MTRPALVLALLLLAAPAHAMQLTSPDFANGSALSLRQVKCGGSNVSPALQWGGEPGSTKSFALTVFDSDARGGSGWWHWIVLDIPAAVHELASGAGNGSGMPAGAVQGTNDFRGRDYGGPCPPPGSGEHHYRFTLWAMPSAGVPLAADADPEAVGQYLASHALDKVELVGIYQH